MKSVFLEKHEFEKREESISQSILAIVVHQSSNKEKDLILVLGSYFSRSKIFSTATLVEEVKPEERLI